MPDHPTTTPPPRRFRIDDGRRVADGDVVRAQLVQLGWTETGGGDWDLFWSFHPHDRRVAAGVRPDQRINHFPGVMTLHHKDELAHFLDLAAREEGLQRYPFVPATFVLPAGEAAWRAAAALEPDAVWILKPTNDMSGSGIRLVRGDDAVPHERGWLVQRYIDDPLLLPGERFKHALRVMVLVTALDPLVAYVHPRPIVKFASRPFSLDGDDLRDRMRHLTNPGVNRLNTDVAEPVRNLPWDEWCRALTRLGHDPGQVWQRIRELLATTLRAHEPPVRRLSEAVGARLGSCFELLGFDLTLDREARPWLVECNASPGISFRGRPGSATHEVQRRAKVEVVADLFRVLGADRASFDTGDPADRIAAEQARRGHFEVLLPD